MEPLRLSPSLIQAVQDRLCDVDSRAEDPGVTAQYLSAIIGILVGQQRASRAEKQDLLEQLAAFSNHVMEDVSRQQNQQPAAPQGEAYGVWKPGDP